MRIHPIAICLGVAVTPGFALTAHAGYDVTVLQDAGGQGDSLPNAINASGQSVGNSSTATGSAAVKWSPAGKATADEKRADHESCRSPEGC
jgi:hypothetical protein